MLDTKLHSYNAWKLQSCCTKCWPTSPPKVAVKWLGKKQNRCAVSSGLFNVRGVLQHADGREFFMVLQSPLQLKMMSDKEKQPYRVKDKKCYDETFGRAAWRKITSPIICHPDLQQIQLLNGRSFHHIFQFSSSLVSWSINVITLL